MDYKICAENQYLGTGTDGCPACLPCALDFVLCPNGSLRVKNPKVENKCPTYTCFKKPIIGIDPIKYEIQPVPVVAY